ncbi:DUF4397 domain-containing protein [Desertivirga xinjiangensis]|uniref:DUF4397 domain-containing protein n=1 Tax=Desertivirga xinjiangensis TaxID=539206 RepID=UPI00210BAB9D|nr:DUF4397 domain-containing protein [Pedobacter xinjiangensis]
MNYSRKTTKKNRGYFLALCLGLFSLVLLSSCNKNDDDDFEQPDVSGIKFIHSLPAQTSLDFYVDGQRATGAALTVNQYTNYIGVYSRKSLIQAAVGGTSTEVFKDTIDLVVDKGYSVFPTYKYLSKNDSTTSVILEDNLNAPASGKAKVRFLNLSRSATGVDFRIKDQTTNLSGARAYNQASEFMEMDPGSLTFEVLDAGTATVRATSAATTISSGKIYTIWTIGIAGGTGAQEPKVYLVEH